MGHLGFTPQYINSLGGYYVQGKSYENSVQLLEDARKLEQAGAFAVVLEMVPEETAKYISENVSIPTIGIGAGSYCDGQVLVIDDVLGKYSNFTPKFAKKYADIKSTILECSKNYINDVKNSNFPQKEHVFNLTPEELEKLEQHFIN